MKPESQSRPKQELQDTVVAAVRSDGHALQHASEVPTKTERFEGLF